MVPIAFYVFVRTDGESVAIYVAALRDIAQHCEYKDTLQDMLSQHVL